jgi:hypothetical protein
MRKIRVLAFMVALIYLFLFLGATWLSNIEVTEPQHGTINITAEQYEEAIAKWHAHDVEEYEISLHYLMGISVADLTLRVNDSLNDIHVVHHSNSEGNDSPPGPLDRNRYGWLQEYTVDKLFTRVADILSNGPFEMGEVGTDMFAFYYDYDIQFDPALGYPTNIKRNGRAPSHWEKEGIFSSGPSHYSYFISVKSLKVITKGEE